MLTLSAHWIAVVGICVLIQIISNISFELTNAFFQKNTKKQILTFTIYRCGKVIIKFVLPYKFVTESTLLMMIQWLPYCSKI